MKELAQKEHEYPLLEILSQLDGAVGENKVCVYATDYGHIYRALTLKPHTLTPMCNTVAMANSITFTQPRGPSLSTNLFNTFEFYDGVYHLLGYLKGQVRFIYF